LFENKVAARKFRTTKVDRELHRDLESGMWLIWAEFAHMRRGEPSSPVLEDKKLDIVHAEYV
jgi:hypothetical protein